MRLIGQRWEFQIGNTVIQVDNAFSWTKSRGSRHSATVN
jgi:hypothetical protein